MSDHNSRGAWFPEARGGRAAPDKDPSRGPAVPGIDRMCQRAGCQQSATVTLSFRYDARQASLVDLLAERDPAYYDLCAFHADLLVVPKGWERLDRRSPPPEPPSEPSATPASVEGDRRLDRYAALTAELPRLAQACGLTPPSGSRTRSGDALASGARGAAQRIDHAPAPARGMDPTATAATMTAAATVVDEPDVAGHPYEPVTGTLLPEVLEFEGQLQMPIESEQRGVVVALTRTRDA